MPLLFPLFSAFGSGRCFLLRQEKLIKLIITRRGTPVNTDVFPVDRAGKAPLQARTGDRKKHAVNAFFTACFALVSAEKAPAASRQIRALTASPISLQPRRLQPARMVSAVRQPALSASLTAFSTAAASACISKE